MLVRIMKILMTQSLGRWCSGCQEFEQVGQTIMMDLEPEEEEDEEVDQERGRWMILLLFIPLITISITAASTSIDTYAWILRYILTWIWHTVSIWINLYCHCFLVPSCLVAHHEGTTTQHPMIGPMFCARRPWTVLKIKRCQPHVSW